MSKLESIRVLEMGHDIIGVECYFQGAPQRGLSVPRGTSPEDVSRLFHQFADLIWAPPAEAEQPPAPEVVPVNPTDIPPPAGNPEPAPPDTGGVPKDPAAVPPEEQAIASVEPNSYPTVTQPDGLVLPVYKPMEAPPCTVPETVPPANTAPETVQPPPPNPSGEGKADG